MPVKELKIQIKQTHASDNSVGKNQYLKNIAVPAKLIFKITVDIHCLT
jgi:hypothetical protein